MSWYRTFVRRRMENLEENDWSLTPIALSECYRAQDALTRVDRLSDMGIYPISKWSLKARCYLHGWQSRDIESTELAPSVRRIRCWSCDKDLPVTARVKERSEGTGKSETPGPST